MTEKAVLQRWRVRVGDRVEAGQTVADMETDKATIEMSAPEAGVVAALLVREGEQIVSGREFIRIEPIVP